MTNKAIDAGESSLIYNTTQKKYNPLLLLIILGIIQLPLKGCNNPAERTSIEPQSRTQAELLSQGDKVVLVQEPPQKTTKVTSQGGSPPEPNVLPLNILSDEEAINLQYDSPIVEINGKDINIDYLSAERRLVEYQKLRENVEKELARLGFPKASLSEDHNLEQITRKAIQKLKEEGLTDTKAKKHIETLIALTIIYNDNIANAESGDDWLNGRPYARQKQLAKKSALRKAGIKHAGK